jgi:ankyrin repeat protein
VLRQLLAAGVDPNETGASGRTPLMIAAHLDLADAAQILLEQGAAIDATSGDKVTKIYPMSDDVLCQEGHDWDPNDTPGRTALSYAAESATPELVALLLTHGAVADKPDSSGHTPADYATGRSDQDTARKIAAMLQSAK